MSKLNRVGARVKASSGSYQSPTETLIAAVRELLARPWLLGGVSWGAIGLSCATAAIGVAGFVGFESPLAKVGTVVLVAGTLLTEIAASRLPTHAERRIREGAPLKGAAVISGFIALTAWNLIAGHLGMAAIDNAGVADKRAPLEATAASADATRETAEEALTAFDVETERQQDGMATALRGAFEAGYVTAGTRSAQAMNTDPARSERRERLARDVSVARAADRVAERQLANAPTHRDDRELWAFAVVLELLKGALVWFATAVGARTTRNNVGRTDPRAMSPAERRAFKKFCASGLATLRHLEAAMA